MVLNIAEIEKQLTVWKDRILIRSLTAFHVTAQGIVIAIQAAGDVGDSLAEDVDLWDERFGVVDAYGEYLVLDRLGLALCGPGKWLEAINNVVSKY